MRKTKSFLILVVLGFAFTVIAQRDPYLWPFSTQSIWNLPIHNDAEYKPAKIGAPQGAGILCDEDYIILTPDAEKIPVYKSYVGWSHYLDRCEIQGEKMFEAPIPSDFILSSENWIGEMPNAGVAILEADGHSIIQTQPFAKCEKDYATSWFYWPEISIYGDGIIGAHGGSGMSSFGGALRLGDLVPGNTIRHALKINVYAAKYLYYDAETEGYRWPAVTADGYAPGMYGKKGTPEYECRMGALLALHKDLDLNSMNFETGADGPAMILAKALQNYGAYIVDDTYWDVVAFSTEHSPEGRMIEEFENEWGFPFESSQESPFGRDLAKIITALHVVTNNSAETIGGGSTNDLMNRRAEPACEFGMPGSGLKCPQTLQAVALPTAITLNKHNLTLGLNDQYTLKVDYAPVRSKITKISWKSENPAIATVDENGRIKPLKIGKTRIIAESPEAGLKDVSDLEIVKKLASEESKTKKVNYTHKLGDLYQGGIIVHVHKGADGKEHGLIASLLDLSPQPVRWGDEKITGASSLDNGVENTKKMISQFGADKMNPAVLCDTYTHEGFDDWYLPAIKELNMIWEALDIVNQKLNNDDDPKTNGMQQGSYWSSTEHDAHNAWMDFMPNSFFGYYPKSIVYPVRAVRKF